MVTGETDNRNKTHNRKNRNGNRRSKTKVIEKTEMTTGKTENKTGGKIDHKGKIRTKRTKGIMENKTDEEKINE